MLLEVRNHALVIVVLLGLKSVDLLGIQMKQFVE